MRIVFTIMGLVVLSLLGGCITSSVINDATTTESKWFYPKKVWHNPLTDDYLIDGFTAAPKGSDMIPCYVRIPASELNELKDERNEIFLSKIGYRGMAHLKLEVGPIPQGYIVIPSSPPPPGGPYTTDQKKTVHFAHFAVIPFTIILDVVTLPVQVLVYTNFPEIN